MLQENRKRKIIDLSHEMYTGMPLYPGIGPATYVENFFRQRKIHRISSTTCIFNDHAGTHIDAPIHFDEKGLPIDKAPLELMHSTGLVLDMSDKKPGQYIMAEDIKERCKKLDVEIKPNFVILFHTGASKKWGTPEYYEYLVGIKPESIRWLYKNGVKVYGVDAVTTDFDLLNHPTHRLLREFEHYIIENLTNLDKIPTPTFEFVGYPIKIRGASASPIRAVAIVYES